MSQMDIILKAMLENNKEWTAKDFQYGKNFVGYEASARMSDLVKKYPTLFIINKIGRFRSLQINWEEKELIKELCKKYEIKPQKHSKGINILKSIKHR